MTRSELLDLADRVVIVTGGASGQTPSIVAEAVPGAAIVVADVSEQHIRSDDWKISSVVFKRSTLRYDDVRPESRYVVQQAGHC